MQDKEKVVVATSGYFDPLHTGHIEYLEKAKALGDKLIVIVNSDKQAILKKGCPFMKEKERMRIVGALRCVDEVFLCIDEDKTVCRSLEKIRPKIFAKGGDRFIGEIPETPICKKLDIQIIDGLGEKIQSSSELVKNANIQQ
jgi:rfaE bifunctional protein nucleotidyltransferase chain/domain